MGNKLPIELGEHIKKQLGEEKSKEFMAKYSALLEQCDTSDVWRQFAIWVLVDPKDGSIRCTDPGSDQHDVIKHIAQLYIDDCKDIATWEMAAEAACKAAEAAATYSLFSPVRAAEAAAALVVFQDADADDDISIAAVTFAAYAATYDARYDHYHRMANKLIELLQAAPRKIILGAIDASINETMRTCK